MWRTLKLLAWTVSPLGAAAYAFSWYHLIRSDVIFTPEMKIASWAFLAGGLFWILLGKHVRFFHVFEHEATHMLFTILFFKKPRYFLASEEGGAVGLYGNNFVIKLAPYFFPTYSYALLLGLPLLRPELHTYLYAVLGFITSYHVISLFEEFHLDQPDITSSGVVFSVVFCLFGNILFLGLLLAIMAGGLQGGLDFLRDGMFIGYGFAEAAVHFILSLLRPPLDTTR